MGNSKTTEGGAEKVTSKKTLQALLARGKVAASRSAEERGAYGAKVKAAEENENLNAKAFRVVAQMAKMDPAKLTVMWRDVQAYADLLGFNDQKDLLDALKGQPDTRSEMERALDGEPMSEAEKKDADGKKLAAEMERESAVDELLDGGGAVGNRSQDDAAHVARFRSAMAAASDVTAVNTGLDRFSEDYPHLAEDAMGIAEDRLKTLASADNRPKGSQPKAANPNLH